jgi:hypothetical protein
MGAILVENRPSDSRFVSFDFPKQKLKEFSLIALKKRTPQYNDHFLLKIEQKTDLY